MAGENAYIDDNSRNTITALANDGSKEIYNVRINPITGAVVCEADVVSSNTSIGSTIPGGTAGSVLFLGPGSTLDEDNTNFFYDPTDHFLGLGTDTPTATLDILGTLKYVDGAQTNGYVLTSDGSGNATWHALPPSGLVDPGSNGIVVRTALNTTTARTLTGTVNRITITNGSGIAGNPTVDISSSYIAAIANGGTGQTTANSAFNALVPSQGGNNGKFLKTDGTNTSWATETGTGTVTSVSVVTANGLAGTVATSTTTPAITLSTTVTGLLKGNGTAISAAVSGTDYLATVATDATLTGNGTSGSPLSVVGSGGGSTPFSINQIAHGFTVGDIIRPTINQWTFSQSDTDTDAEAWAQVTIVTDADHFTALPLQGNRQMDSDIVTLIAGFLGGTVLYVDGTTPGALTDTPPTASGTVSKPVGYVEADASGTPIAFLTVNYRGQENQVAPGGVSVSRVGLIRAGGSGTGSQTIAHGLGKVPSLIMVSASGSPGGSGGSGTSTGSATGSADQGCEWQYNATVSTSGSDSSDFIAINGSSAGVAQLISMDGTNIVIDWVSSATYTVNIEFCFFA